MTQVSTNVKSKRDPKWTIAIVAIFVITCLVFPALLPILFLIAILRFAVKVLVGAVKFAVIALVIIIALNIIF